MTKGEKIKAAREAAGLTQEEAWPTLRNYKTDHLQV